MALTVQRFLHTGRYGLAIPQCHLGLVPLRFALLSAARSAVDLALVGGREHRVAPGTGSFDGILMTRRGAVLLSGSTWDEFQAASGAIARARIPRPQLDTTGVGYLGCYKNKLHASEDDMRGLVRIRFGLNSLAL
jgi:hypothetical protein